MKYVILLLFALTSCEPMQRVHVVTIDNDTIKVLTTAANIGDSTQVYRDPLRGYNALGFGFYQTKGIIIAPR